jgi:hypothetical protein
MAFEVAKGIVRLGPDAAPAEELGFRPRAVVLWWCREPATGCTGGIGFAADAAGEASTAWFADDAAAPGVLSSRTAETVLVLHEDPRSADAAAHGRILFADHGFSVECDRRPAHTWLVHYLAVGGPDVRGAAVRSVVLDGAGKSAVTGLGFAPGIVLAAAGAGSDQSGLAVAFGAAAGPSQQVAGGFVAQADDGRATVRGAQCGDALAVLPAADASGEIATLSRLVSLDRDGFTLDTARAATPLRLAVLALAGGRYAVGVGRATSRSTAVGFEPAGGLLFGTGLATMSRARDIGRMCLGGLSRQGVGCLSWSVRAHGAWPLDPRARSTAGAAFEVVDTTSEELHARATLSGLGRRRFSLAWPVRDRYGRDFGYVAFGPERRLRLFGRGGSLRE